MPLFVENAPGEGNAQARSSLLHDNMANDDPPKHTALRKPVNGTFTSRAVATKRAGVRALAEETLDTVADQESFSHVKDFAFPFSIAVICSTLGVPERDRGTFDSPVKTITSDAAPDVLKRDAGLTVAYLSDLIARKRAGDGFAKPEDQRGRNDSGTASAGELVESGGDRAEPLEACEASFDHVALAVVLLVEGGPPADEAPSATAGGRLVAALGDRDGDAAAPQHVPDRPAGVGLVVQDSGRCPAKAQSRTHLRLVRSLNDHFPSPASGVVRAQYTSQAFAGACPKPASVSPCARSAARRDNALAESCNATCESETLQGRKHWSS